MEEKQTKVQSFLGSLLPAVQVKSDLGVKQSSLIDVGVVLFLTATLIMLTYFSLKKVLS